MSVVPAAAAAGELLGGGTALQWFSAASPLLGKAMGGTPAGPSRADATLMNDAHFDSSGWVVATSGSTAEGTLKKSDTGQTASGLADIIPGMNAGNGTTWLLLGLGFLVLWKLTR